MKKIGIFIATLFIVMVVNAQTPSPDPSPPPPPGAKLSHDVRANATLASQWNTMKDQLTEIKNQVTAANNTLTQAEEINKTGKEMRNIIGQYRNLASEVYNGTWGLADSFVHLADTLTNMPNQLTAETWKTLQELGCLTDDIKKFSANDRLKAIQGMSLREYNIKNKDGSYTYVYDDSAPQFKVIDMKAYQAAIKKRENDRCQLAGDRDMSGYGNDMLTAGQIKDRIKEINQGVSDFNDDALGTPMQDDNGRYIYENGKIKRSTNGSLTLLLNAVGKYTEDDANLQKQIYLLNQMMAKLLLMNHQMLVIAQSQLELQEKVSLPKVTAPKEDKYVMPRTSIRSICSRPQFAQWCKEQQTAIIGDTTSSTFKAFKEALKEIDSGRDSY